MQKLVQPKISIFKVLILFVYSSTNYQYLEDTIALGHFAILYRYKLSIIDPYKKMYIGNRVKSGDCYFATIMFFWCFLSLGSF